MLHLKEEETGIKLFLKQLACKHIYCENTGWFEYSKGNRETVYCYGFQKMCLRCGDNKFYPIGKSYTLINPEDKEAIEKLMEKQVVIKEKDLKDVVKRRESLNLILKNA